MKKGSVFLAFVFFSLMFGMISFASAAGPGDAITALGNNIDSVVTALQPILQSLIGNVTGIGGFSSGDMFFAKVVIFLILMSIVYVVLMKFPFVHEYSWIVWLLSIAIPLLALRFSGSESIMLIILPNQAFGIALSCLLPLAIYTVFVESAFNSRTLRKVAWVFAAVLFMFLYISRWEALGNLSSIYLIAVLASLGLLFFDGTIQNAIRKSQSENLEELSKAQGRTVIRRKRKQLEEDRLNGVITGQDYAIQNAELSDLEKLYGIR